MSVSSIVAGESATLIIHYTKLSLILLSIFPFINSKYTNNQTYIELPTAAERTRSIALLFSFIQCFPNTSSNNALDAASLELLQIHQNFNPETHINEYTNLTDIENLVSFVKSLEDSGKPNNLPFTNAPQHIYELNLVLLVLYHNSGNWPLFYNTSVWLLQRVNTAMLFWAVTLAAADKYGDTVTIPSAVEVFPQLYLPKNYVLAAAGLNKRETPLHPVHYWISDPGLNEFHFHWHKDNPFFWDESVYHVARHRKGELFLYMHHQLVCRYNAELLSHGIGEVEPLGLQPNDTIEEGYIPDIVNVNYADFFSREDGKRVGDFDDGTILNVLRQYYERLQQGIEQGFFVGPEGDRVNFQGENGTDVLGNTAESATVLSVNWAFYGSLHNYMHRLLGGTLRLAIPGIESHPETSARDPVFYRLHKKVDLLLLQYKSMVPAYTQDDLDFPGISILTADILTRPHGNVDTRWRPTSADINWPFTPDQQPPSPTLTTYFRTETFDISNAARPCRAINDEPVPVQVRIIDYVPFSYVIAIQSMRPTVAYGMVRIFMWPEYTNEGKLLEGDEAHERAIELDRFRVRIEPGRATVLTRSSLDSTLTKVEPIPGIKTLYNVKDGSDYLTRHEIRRACGFPNNLLIPRGNKKGISFKMVVYVSEETDADEVEKNQFPHYPFCGALHGLPFPDKRSMGFPFDRPGTRFNMGSTLESSSVFGCSPTMKNVKEINLVVKHDSD